MQFFVKVFLKSIPESREVFLQLMHELDFFRSGHLGIFIIREQDAVIGKLGLIDAKPVMRFVVLVHSPADGILFVVGDLIVAGVVLVVARVGKADRLIKFAVTENRVLLVFDQPFSQRALGGKLVDGFMFGIGLELIVGTNRQLCGG